MGKFKTLSRQRPPRRREIWMMQYEPTVPPEAPGIHPVLILSPEQMNQRLAIVCHISSGELKGQPSIFLDPKVCDHTDGYIYYGQVRTVAWEARSGAYRGICPQAVFDDVIDHLLAILDPASDDTKP